MKWPNLNSQDQALPEAVEESPIDDLLLNKPVAGTDVISASVEPNPVESGELYPVQQPGVVAAKQDKNELPFKKRTLYVNSFGTPAGVRRKERNAVSWSSRLKSRFQGQLLEDYEEWQRLRSPESSSIDSPAIGRRNGHSGRHTYVPNPRGSVYTAPTTQACGLYPFVVGSGSPKVGVPLGPHVIYGETVCFDPFFWLRDRIVTNPGVFVIGQPGIGKSSTVKRLIMGMAGFGHRPLILGDVKPDYPEVIEALDGQVISMGRGKDRINPLDKGPISAAAKRLASAGMHDRAQRLHEEAAGRRLALLVGLCQVGRRGDKVEPYEEIMLANCLQIFDEKGIEAPLLGDVVSLLRDPPMELVERCGFIVPGHSRLTSKAEQQLASNNVAGLSPLELKGLEGFLSAAQGLFHTLEIMLAGSLKGIFDGPTTTPIDLDAKAVEIDISAISSVDDDQGIAAAMLAVWSYSFGTVDAALELSDAGLIPRRNYVAVLDELWRALRGSSGLVERIDSLTRVNRQKSMSQILVTHSLADLEALASESDRSKAKGLIDRCGTKFIGAVPANELEALSEHVGGLTKAEKDMIGGWTAPADWSGESIHPGMGRMLIKAGERSGLPVAVTLTEPEIAMFETTKIAVAELEKDVEATIEQNIQVPGMRKLPPQPPKQLPQEAMDLSINTYQWPAIQIGDEDVEEK